MEFNYFQQLYDKGVDIGANVSANLITALVLGGLARAFWRQLLPQELVKALHVSRTTRLDDEWATCDALRSALLEFGTRAETASDYARMRVLWDDYVNWLERNDLVRANADSARTREHLNGAVRGGHPANIPGTQKLLSATIEATVIPEPTQSRPLSS